MDRLINYAFLLCLIYLFVLESGTEERYQIGIALIAGVLFTLVAFIFKWLTLDGAIAALVFGCVTLGFGGWQAAVLILVFFITSTLLSQKSIVVVKETAKAYAERERRDGIQVWSNGFWFAFFILLGFLLESELFLMGATGAIATATADTWATELGSKRYKGTTYLLSDFREVKAGTDGGISMTGTLGAFAGSLLIAIIAVLCYPISWGIGLVTIFVAGFSGCFLDSYLGATLQGDNKTVSFGTEDPYLSFGLDNNFVNWAATGFGSVVAVITNLLLI